MIESENKSFNLWGLHFTSVFYCEIFSLQSFSDAQISQSVKKTKCFVSSPISDWNINSFGMLKNYASGGIRSGEWEACPNAVLQEIIYFGVHKVSLSKLNLTCCRIHSRSCKNFQNYIKPLRSSIIIHVNRTLRLS